MNEELYRRKLNAARYSYRVARMRHHKAVAFAQRLAVLAACAVVAALLIGAGVL